MTPANRATTTPGQSVQTDCPFFIPKDSPKELHRQLEVLVLSAQGYTYQAVGRRLSITPRTVRAHLEEIRGVLGAMNTTHAVAIAVALGFIRVDLSALKVNTDPAN